MSLWHVEMGPGDVRSMTLDELDAVFQEGVITGDTRIREEGSLEWTTLAEVAGLDDDPTDVHAMPPPNAQPQAHPVSAPYPLQQPNSLSPMAISAPEPVQQIDLAALAAEDDDELAFRPKKKTGLVLGAIGGVALFAALGIVGMTQLKKLDAKTIDANTTNALAVQAPAPVVNDIPKADDKSRLTEDQKRALADIDKKHQSEIDKKNADKAADRAARQPAQRGKPMGKSNDPFVKNTNKYDPLNGAL